MSPCVDYRRHEFDCPHRRGTSPRRRWRAADGCSGEVCDDCWYAPGGPADWADLVQVGDLDTDGIPLDPREWTAADQLGVVIRALRDAGEGR